MELYNGLEVAFREMSYGLYIKFKIIEIIIM